MSSNKATEEVARRINLLAALNGRTAMQQVREMFLGQGIFVAVLAEPKVIEGQWVDTDRTADLFDLMEAYDDGEPMDRQRN